MNHTRQHALVVAAFFIVALALTGCGEKPYATPEATAQKFADAMNAEDIEAAVACFAPRDQTVARNELTEAIKKDNAEGKKAKNEMSYKGMQKDGEWILAIFSVKEAGGSATTEVKMVMVDVEGEWKISDRQTEEYYRKKAGFPTR